ncbi:MAG: chromate transporter [Erysipelotrichaceae bacterium]|nr:chromate transporter [Erysipelotrichaceae bacterium]
MKSNQSRLLKLFVSTLYISAFTFGGGFVIASLMKKRFVDDLKWIDEEEMLDIIAIAQSSPGAIAVNSAIAVGWKVGGFIGMIVAVLGTIIPPMLILTAVSFFYSVLATNRIVALFLKGMQAGVAAVIFDVVINLGHNVIKGHSFFNDCLMLVAFVLVFFFDINVIAIIIMALVIGIFRAALARRKS